MNKIFKIVFNAARGKMMVVNEATSSVQTGKKAAVTVAVIGALASGVACAATELTNSTTVPVTGGDFYLGGDVEITAALVSDPMFKDSKIDLKGHSLTLLSNDNHEGLGTGAIKNTEIFGGGDVTIKQLHATGECVFGQGVASITADNITLSSANTWVAYLDQPGDKVTLDANNGGNVDATDLTNHTITMSGSSGGGGVYVVAGAEFTAKNFNSLKIENISDKKDHGYGVNNNGGKFTVENGGLVEISADERSALVSYDANAETDISAQKIVVESTIKNESDAFKASGVGMKAGKVSLKADEISISTTGLDTQNTVYGVAALEGSSFEAISSKLNIEAKGKAATGVRAVSSKVTLGEEGAVVTVSSNATTGNAYGIQIRNNYSVPSKLTIDGAELNITANAGESGSGMGLIVQGMTTAGGDPMSEMIVNAEKTVINATDVGVWASGDASAKLDGETSIEITAPVAIEGRDYAKVKVNESGKADVVIKGDVDFSKQYDGDNKAQVDINLNTAASSWEGNVKLAWIKGSAGSEEEFKQAKLNVNLANGAQWTPTKVEGQGTMGSTEEGVLATAVRTMNMDGGVVNVNAGVDAKLDNLTGSGTVNLAVADAENVGSFTANNGDGANLAVNLTGVTADDLTAEEAEALMENVSVANATVTGNVEEGLYNGAITVDTEGNAASVGASSTMQNVLDIASNGTLSLNRIALNDVRKRMGDLRAAEGTHGVWARYNGGTLSGARGFENDFTTIQVGIDTVPVADAPRFGVAFSYTTSDADMNRGGAEMDAYSLAFYGTKMYDNGVFVDVIGRMAKADTDITVNVGGEKTGTMDNIALSLSGELGWRFDVTDTFYVEPQAELTYTYVNSDTLTMSGGNEFKFDSVDSLMGRVGFAAGFKCPNNFGDVYVRASAVHEFLGDSAVTGKNGNTLETNGEDTWVEFGVGANFNINKNTYVYADLERTEGADLETDWRANVGVRFAF